MKWPEQPTCHAGKPYSTMRPVVWETREDEHFRRCNYCGSMHPEDLIAALQQGAKLGGSDWKYGWPHKFYVEVPNPTPERQVYRGGSSYIDETTGQRVTTEEYGDQGPCIHAKWYNDHLRDDGYDDDAWGALVAALAAHAGITFRIDDLGNLMYTAPYHGYQA